MPSTALKEAIFGSFDGLVSVLGIVLAAVLAHADPRVVVLTALGGAIAATVSMAGGQFLADGGTARGKRARAAMMGGATFVGSFLPVVPFVLLPQTPALLSALALAGALTLCIAEARSHTTEKSRIAAYGETFGILAVAGSLAVGITRLVGSVP